MVEEHPNRESVRKSLRSRICRVIDRASGGLAAVAFFALAVACGIGVLAIFLFAFGDNAPAQGVSVLGTALAISCASMVIGSLAGFLFGIPRTFQNHDEPVSRSKEPEYRPNTNLEQISDWLTKILVGVGLTQMAVIPKKLWNISDRLAPGLGGQPGSAGFGLILIIFFSVAGFLVGYMWTRIYFRKVLMDAERDPGVSKEELNQKVQEVDTTNANLSAAIGAAVGALAMDEKDPLRPFYLSEAIRVLQAQTEHLHIRTVAIFLGRLFRHSGKLEEADLALSNALDERRRRGIVPNIDDADLLYNRACYQNLRARQHPEAGNDGMRKYALKLLAQSLELSVANANDALIDPDLAPDLIELAQADSRFEKLLGEKAKSAS